MNMYISTLYPPSCSVGRVHQFTVCSSYSESFPSPVCSPSASSSSRRSRWLLPLASPLPYLLAFLMVLNLARLALHALLLRPAGMYTRVSLAVVNFDLSQSLPPSS